MKKWHVWSLVGVAAVAGIGLAITSNLCVSAYFRYGLCLGTCPQGKLRQTLTLEADGLRRGAKGAVLVGALAHYTVGSADEERVEPIGDFDASLALVDAAGQETPLRPEKGWKGAGRDRRRAEVKLPEVADGDYQLRVRVSSKVGTDQLDLPLALYAPARVHVLTDRPLYEPGNVVHFRAVALRARDLAPLDGRPGSWIVKDPSGEVLLEEKAPAGDWGVVAGSFPLDQAAETGAWSVAWTSGDASDEVSFTVEPFTLPRFRVEAAPDRPFYRAGDSPRVKGAVVYSSGAPVAGAAVEIDWTVDGEWPPPTAWLESALPRRATAGADGRFTLELPAIPADLRGQARLAARLAATDAAGDRVASAAVVQLSEDAIQVSAVSELADGLVEGFNNRLYLRVTTADGRPLPAKAKIRVRRAWDPKDPGLEAELDEDSVASLQIDPGPAVNVVIPPMPARPAPRPKVVARGAVSDLLAGEEAGLDDLTIMDRWVPDLTRCAKYHGDEDSEVTLLLRVSGAGAIVTAGGSGTRLADCALGLVRGKRLAPGRERLYTVDLSFTDPDLPHVTVSTDGPFDGPDGLEEAAQAAAADARDCVPDAAEGQLPRAALWQARKDSRDVTLAWIADPQGDAEAAAAVPCVQARVTRLALEDKSEVDAMGLLRFAVEPPERVREARPQPTIMEGYELAVAAEVDGQPAGETRLRMTPGSVPALRLRPTPVLVAAGDEVRVDLLRGPSFSGELPKELLVRHLKGEAKLKVDRDAREARFAVDPKMEGWLQIEGGGARALVYVRPPGELAVTVSPEHPRYAPGQTARLTLQTTVGGQGGPAAVGLFGVDDSLGQLVTLPGPDDMARVRPAAGMSSPAFEVLDGQALALGRVRGANAAAAVILRVSSIPEVPELDVAVSGSAETAFDPVEVLTDRFYPVLAELHAQARAWERSAAPGEKMHPPTMARLWRKAVDACRQRGEAVDDAYGRTLRLSRLPADLLALTDPRAVVVDGTRLPEDVENWAEWVAKEKP